MLWTPCGGLVEEMACELTDLRGGGGGGGGNSARTTSCHGNVGWAMSVGIITWLTDVACKQPETVHRVLLSVVSSRSLIGSSYTRLGCCSAQQQRESTPRWICIAP